MNATATITRIRDLGSNSTARAARGKLPSNALGKAEEKYQRNGWVPHSDDLFSAVLNQSTSNSGHNHLCQRTESTAIDSRAPTKAAEAVTMAAFRNCTRLCQRSAKPTGAINTKRSHRNIAAAMLRRTRHLYADASVLFSNSACATVAIWSANTFGKVRLM